MYKIKLFVRKEGSDMEQTQNLINEWLYNHQHYIIKDIKCEDEYVCIIYEVKNG